MKKIHFALAVLCFSFLFRANAQTRPLVNQDWVMTGGSPSGMFDYQASHIDASHNLIVVGNTFHSGQQENFLIRKYNPAGVLLWSKEYDGTLSGIDFATDVTTQDTNIYVTGVEGDTTLHTSSITTLMLNGSGSIIWTAKYAGSYHGYNIPARINAVTGASKIWVTGTSQIATTGFQMVTIMYNSSGVQQWVNTYDSSGLYNGGADLVLGASSSVTTYGVSGLSTSSGDFVTQTINGSGTTTGIKRVNNTNSYITKPIAMVKDVSENIYITGVVQTSPNNTDIKVVKLDSLLNVKWVKVLDGGANGNDEVAGMKIDLKGNLVLTGFAAAADTSKSVWTIRMKDSVIVWSQNYFCPIAHKDAKGASVDLDSLGNIYLTGKIYNGTNFTGLTLSYDTSGHIKWQQTYSVAGSDNQGQNVIVDSGGYIYSNGRTGTSGSYKYTTIKYEPFTPPTAIQNDANGKPLYAIGQTLVRFNPGIVNKNFVNNVKMQFTVLDSLIPDSVILKMNSNTGLQFHGTKVAKIFEGLTTTDTISITRSGKRIKIPTFWADFILYPNLGKSNDTLVVTALSKMPQQIFKCEVNGIAVFASNSPNDPKFTSNKQKALCNATEGIDACTAWNSYAGSSDIKIGHYDTGIKFTHEDFQFGGNSVVAGGYDFYNNVNILSEPNNDVQGHGTVTSSIYGAVSNNSKGIAGVAGGDGGSGTQGVSIYDLKVANDTGGVTVFASTLFSAYVMAATLSPVDTTGTVFGYGVFITNHSYVKSILNGTFMMDGIRWCFQNGITTVAASGNDNSTNAYYPASFYDDWVIKVGANDETGARWVDTINVGSTYGNNLDLVAPGTNNSNDYISYCTNTSNSSYDNAFFGTSLAAPFVTGSAALIMGYIAHAYPSQQFSAPEDIEHLLQFYTKDIASGYTSQTGWGRLDIGNVFNSLSYPKYKIRQNFGAFDSTNATLLASGVSITLAYNAETSPYPQFINLPAMSGINPVTYTVDVYHLSGTVSHSPALDPTETVISTYGQHAWVLNSSSNMWGLYNSSNVLTPEVDVTLANVTNTQADVDAYTYHFTASSADTSIHDLWLPFNPFNNFGTYAYSLHTVNSAINGIDEIATETNTLNAFPNPTSNELNISIYTSKPENVYLTMTNIDGQVLYTKQLENSNGSVNFTINTASFASGMYFLNMRTENNSNDKKVVIIH